MKKSGKKVTDRTIAIIFALASLFIYAGIVIGVIFEGKSVDYTNLGVGLCFTALAAIYDKQYKDEN